MKINEVINDPVNEGFISGLSKGIGAVGGALAGSWDSMKQGYQAGKNWVLNPTNTATPSTGTTTSPTTDAASSGTNTPTAKVKRTRYTFDQLKQIINGLTKDQKNKILSMMQQVQPAAPQPAGTSLDLDAYQQQRQAEIEKARAQQQGVMQQMQQTQQANAANAQADSALIAAVKAAKAKPPFQQTASDKLAIKQGAAKGIHESKKKKKIVREFHSKFLNMMI